MRPLVLNRLVEEVGWRRLLLVLLLSAVAAEPAQVVERVPLDLLP